MEGSPPEAAGIPPERIQYYQNQAQELFIRRGNDFDRFTQGLERLVEAGDEV